MAKSESTIYLSPMAEGEEDKEPKNFYLWEYQPHFVSSVETAARQLFRKLDDEIKPDVFLVDINAEKENNHPRAVVEPPDHEFKAADFERVLELADELENATSSPNYAYSVENPAAGEAWLQQNQRRDFRANVRRAVQQTINGACVHDKQRIYVSGAREVGPFLVFTVLMIPERNYNSHPKLHQTERGRYSVVASLMDATGATFVSECYNSILSSLDGSSNARFPDADTMLRMAGESFMYTPCGACDEFDGLHGGFATCNEIATLTYEKSVGFGRVILARTGHDNVVETISFKNPPKLDNYRAVRKLLELSTEEEMLVSNSSVVTGLGRIAGTYDTSKEDMFIAEFTGHAKWQLVHGGVVLMKVEHGVPQLPQIERQIGRFNATFKRLFPNTTDRQRQAIKTIVRVASELQHGTIIVVTEKAEAEAARFGIQATQIEPVPLTEELIEKASRIDGAILVSPDGICFAIGVILDGAVNDKGSSERGARYNSTIRYVYGSECPCIGLVVSDDGMVDVVPEYRPVISKDKIIRTIDDLKSSFNGDKFDETQFKRSMDWLEDHRFYLSETQCTEINAQISRYQSRPQGSEFRRIYHEFEPDADMNESFLKDV